MSFIKLLQGIGDKLGILEPIPVRGTAPEIRIQTRIVTLEQLATEIRSGAIQALADAPAELRVPPEMIFEAAGLKSSPASCTIKRVKEIVESEACRQLSPEHIQKRVLELLALEGISAETLVKDAIARDQALDSFERRLREKMEDRKQSCKSRLMEIERQIGSLQEEKAKLHESLQADEDQWREWKKVKRAQERELASLTSYIIDRAVITTDDEDA